MKQCERCNKLVKKRVNTKFPEHIAEEHLQWKHSLLCKECRDLILLDSIRAAKVKLKLIPRL